MQASYLNACSRLHDVLWDPISDAYLFKKACELLWPAFLKKRKRKHQTVVHLLFVFFIFNLCILYLFKALSVRTLLLYISAEWILIKNLFFCVSASCAHACLCRCWYLILAVRCMCGMVKRWHWHKEKWRFSWQSTSGMEHLITQPAISTH